MSMTKAEKAALEDARTRAALAWPQFTEPTPISAATIERSEGLIEGYVFTVDPASDDRPIRIDRVAQGRSGWRTLRAGEDPTRPPARSEDRTWIAGLRMGLYLTPLDAVRAAQWALCRRMAKRLRAAELLGSELATDQILDQLVR